MGKHLKGTVNFFGASNWLRLPERQYFFTVSQCDHLLNNGLFLFELIRNTQKTFQSDTYIITIVIYNNLKRFKSQYHSLDLKRWRMYDSKITKSLKRFKRWVAMAVTIRDIAKRLNLSVGAVSRALSGYTDIAEETRERIFEAAREMGYTPNRAARQLRKQTTGVTIGYIMPVDSPHFADSFFSEFIEGMGDETAAQHSDLLIATAPPGQEAEKTAYRQWVENSKVDGLILDRLQIADWRVQYLLDKRVPFSTLERTVEYQDESTSYPSVEVDSFQGLIQLVSHIAENGFQRLAYISGPSSLKIQVDRFAGFQAGLTKTNLPFDPQRVEEGDLTSAGGYAATKRLLSIPDPPDAILCVNDETAFGALRAIDEAGLKTGEDIAVAGFDGVRDARYSNPPLTTLDQPVYDIARQLVRLLAAQIAGQPLTTTRVVLQPTLLIRASTGNKT